MKTIFFTILFLAIIVDVGLAKYYIIDQVTNRASSVVEYKPSEVDLATRNEFAVKSDADVSIYMAEYFNGAIRERALSQEEKNLIKENEEEQAEMAEVYHVMFRDAFKTAHGEGKQFKHMDKHVDDVEGEKDKVNKKKSGFNKAKVKLKALGLTDDEVEALR